jgi:hypothetical protein
MRYENIYFLNPLMFWLLVKTSCKNLVIILCLKFRGIKANVFARIFFMCQNDVFKVENEKLQQKNIKW